jgi:hypothetical protein
MHLLKGGALIPLMRGAVHKWNNLLSIISSHAQISLQKEGEWTQEERREEARVLLETVGRAEKINHLIHGILHLPEMRGNQKGPGEEQVCVGTVLRDLWELLLCERHGFRYPVQIKAASQHITSLSRAALFISLTWGVEALLEGIPPSSPGTIKLEVEEVRGVPEVRITFHRDKEHLPFPGKQVHFPEPFLNFLGNSGIQVRSLPEGFRFILPTLDYS